MAARIALVGDYNQDVVAHRGIDRSMELARAAHPGLDWEWVPTGSIGSDPSGRLRPFAGIWVVPASPYASEAGALSAIRLARENGVPFLGTCGGFQHALLEYARNALHLHAASHAETDPHAAIQIISPLSCSLVEQRGGVRLADGSRLRQIYGQAEADEGYHCSFGLNPAYEELFTGGPFRIAARDEAGEVRALELADHPFFFLTLFQPERRALTGSLHPLVEAFVRKVS